jgi:hypothetical protein
VLNINQEKTKYLEINAKRSIINRDTNVQMGQHNFERVQTFSFLGSVICDNNVNSKKILTRINKGNKAFFMNKKLLSSKLIGKQPKMKMYISAVRPIVTYAAETWTLRESDMNYLMIFNRRILRKTFGPVQERGGSRIRTIPELIK